MGKENTVLIVPAKTAFSPGESTTVRVFVKLDEPLKVRGVVALFEGFERTLAAFTDGEGNLVTSEQKHMLYRETFLLHGKAKGAALRFLDSIAGLVGASSGEELPVGEHEYSFELSIPHNAPASFWGVKCRLEYQVSVRVDIPFKWDLKRKKRLHVYPSPTTVQANSIRVIYPDDIGKSFLDQAFGEDVKLDLALDRDQIMPGQQVLAMLVVESKTPLRVNQIIATLCGHESSRTYMSRDKHLHRHELARVVSTDICDNLTYELALKVPESIEPPTYSGKRFDVKWWIEVWLDIPKTKGTTMKIPVKLLSKSISESL